MAVYKDIVKLNAQLKTEIEWILRGTLISTFDLGMNAFYFVNLSLTSLFLTTTGYYCKYKSR